MMAPDHDTNLRNNKLRRFFYFLLIILPGFFIGYFSYTNIKEQLNENVKEKRLAVATLSASIIQERLTHIQNLGKAYAGRPSIRNLVEEGNWQKTTAVLEDIRESSPIIGQAFLTDTTGKVMAHTSASDLKVAENVGGTEWFKGVQKNNNKLYMSKVHKRLAPPYQNTVTAAIPVLGDEDEPVAYLGLQIRLENFRSWADRAIPEDHEHFTLVDQFGQVVFHSDSQATEADIDYGKWEAIQKIKQIERGVEMLVDPADSTEKLTAYAPVKRFGWGVIVPQSIEEAFAERDQNLRLILLVFGTILLLNIIFAILIIRNMVKLSRARKALRESEQRYSLAMQGANDGLWDWDLKTNEVFFSPRYKSMLGYKETEFPNNFDTWKAHVHPNDQEMAETTIKAYLNHETNIYELEHRLRHKDGTYRWILARGMALWNEKGEPYRMVGFHTDLTERKQLEEETLQQQQFLNSIVENIPIMLFVKDAATLRYKRFNKAGEELTGYHEKDLLGKTDNEIHPEDTAAYFTRNDKAALAAGGLTEIEEEEIPTRYKGPRILHTKKIVINNRKGKPKYLLGIAEDITEQKKAEEKIIQLNQELENQVLELERTNKDLQDVTHIISHDLKAPLRGIEMVAKWLQADSADKLNEEEMKNLNLMVERVNRMRNLIDGILRYARIGRTASEKEEIDLNNLIAEITDMLAPPEHIKIKTETTLPHIVVEQAPVMQLFQNLISNAIKYMDKPQGLVRIGAETEGDFWKFYVADNGPGIEEEYFQKIFQIFQTLKPKDEYESTGIGLTIVKKIVETYGGRIWLESKQGEGTTFYFTLPEEMVKEPESAQAAGRHASF